MGRRTCVDCGGGCEHLNSSLICTICHPTAAEQQKALEGVRKEQVDNRHYQVVSSYMALIEEIGAEAVKAIQDPIQSRKDELKVINERIKNTHSLPEEVAKSMGFKCATCRDTSWTPNGYHCDCW